MKTTSTLSGRIMRLPMFDGTLPDKGPIHLVSDEGDEYLLISETSDTPGPVEHLAAASSMDFEPYINQDMVVKGDVLGTVIWAATIFESK